MGLLTKTANIISKISKSSSELQSILNQNSHWQPFVHEYIEAANYVENRDLGGYMYVDEPEDFKEHDFDEEEPENFEEDEDLLSGLNSIENSKTEDIYSEVSFWKPVFHSEELEDI